MSSKEKPKKREETVQIPEIPVAKPPEEKEETKEKKLSSAKAPDKRLKVIVGVILVCLAILVFFYEGKICELKKQKKKDIEEIEEQKKDLQEELKNTSQKINALKNFLKYQGDFEEVCLTKIGEEEAGFIEINGLPKNSRRTREAAENAGVVFYFIEDRKCIEEKLYVKFDFDSNFDEWKVELFSEYGFPIKLVPYESESKMYWFEPQYMSWASKYIVVVTDLETEDCYYIYVCV